MSQPTPDPAPAGHAHWLLLCPLLPACTGPVTAATLLLAAVLALQAARLGWRLPAPAAAPARLAMPVVAAAGVAGACDLLLRAWAPLLHAQVGPALPLVTLAGLVAGRDAGGARTWPAMAAVFAFAGIHALLVPGRLAAELRLLPGPAGDGPMPGLAWHPPATSLVGLAVTLAALEALRAIRRGRTTA